MKKMYLNPEMEIVELKVSSVILTGSTSSATDDIPGGDDGTVGSTPTDPGLIGDGTGL